MSIEQQHMKNVINTVYNAMTILKLFSLEKPQWGISELSRQLNFEISHTKRLVKTLENEGFLRRDPHSKKYELGLAVLSICGVVTSTMEIHREAQPILKEVVEETGEAVHLGILEGVDIVYLIKMDGPHPVRLVTYTGKKLPSYCTGCGKVMLAYQGRKAQRELLKQLKQQGIEQLGPNTVKSIDELKIQLDMINGQGYAVCIDEVHEGVVSVAAPVFDYREQVVAAISVTGPNHRMSPRKRVNYRKSIVQAANKISERLGYPVKLLKGEY